MKKNIEVVPYNPKWPEMFECEAKLIRAALGGNCLAVHHVGSTSVPGLAAKPKIDILAIVKDASTITSGLEGAGYAERGEFNIPFHFGFAKREANFQANLHVYEEGNPEIELNLLFRDYLRSHSDALEEYAHLKLNLIDEPSSHEKSGELFTGYTLGKDAFIKKILKKAGFHALCLRFCTHYSELEKAKKLRQHYFFDRVPIADPYTWTFGQKDHVHFMLYQGVEVIGYAHFQLWQNQRASLRIFLIDEPYQRHGFGSRFLNLCECWLKQQKFKVLHVESRRTSQQFYFRQGYVEMPFNDPTGEHTSPKDISLGKEL